MMSKGSTHGIRGGWWDPWLIAATVGPLALLLLLLGGRPGEPVADDYDYLHQILLTHWSWFDGCGSILYWRPLARQAYYALLAPWMLTQPMVVALVQMGCLCLSSLLLYRTFRRGLNPDIAFAISTAPWMMESSRLLIMWPSCFQDLGALLFVSLALHEAVAARLWSFLASGLAALLCKEVAAIPLIAILACPLVRLDRERQRRTWLLSVALLLAAWAAVYLRVYERASLTIPGPGGGHWPSLAWIPGIAMIPWWLFKAVWSLPPTRELVDLVIAAVLIVSIPWPRVLATLRNHRSEMRAWWFWGLAWSAPLALTLILLYPSWDPYRCALVGLGVFAATMVTLRALHRHAIPAFLLVRLALLAVAPRPVREVTLEPPIRGASIDVPRLSRLQLFVAEVRHELQVHLPRLPHGAVVVQENFPAMTERAFGLRPALHVWYRDTTLKWLPISQWFATPSLPVATVVEYQGNRSDPVALVEPEAMRAMIRATVALNDGRENESLHLLARAESLQVDTSATVFRESVEGKRHYAIAMLRFKEGRYDEARSELLALLAAHPGDVPAHRKLEEVEEILARSRLPQ
ncbi:MAG TPA: hypothetical protein VEY91_10790 [Candidatus Limnocylindria bacterium]|nr:hypothetical protein [Candidatus Limnocylindria bacterium]